MPFLTPSTTNVMRALAITGSVLVAAAASGLMADLSMADGVQVWDGIRVGLIFVTTLWLAWGGAQAMLGLKRLPYPGTAHLPDPVSRTVVAMPICAEDPMGVRARIEAMRDSCARAGVAVDFAILSDTKGAEALSHERTVLRPLLSDTERPGRVYYRNRPDGRGRKAGNIEDFIRSSGAAFDFAVIVDADSLMQGETIGHLIARMQAEPDLGLLQTLPRIVGARSLFGRAMQFASNFYAPVFARGLARLQGKTGPFWGHNAIVRVRAVAECCGLPELSGPPPFGGTILSHDYVEAALLARGGWRVEMDPRILGSYEEGPENLVAYARRDRRWCQGNLQHARIVGASGLRGWSRFTFIQGIVSYLVSVLWAAFLVASVVATATAPLPDYFPEPYQLFPAFPDDGTREMVALALGIGGLLLFPKLAIVAKAIWTGRARAFGGGARSVGSVLAETALTSVVAPIMLLYQSRAVIEVLSGRDVGWPATARGEAQLSLPEAWRSTWWIALIGAASMALVFWISPGLSLWLLPVALPMITAPLIVSWTSREAPGAVFTVPGDRIAPPVVAAFKAGLALSLSKPGLPARRRAGHA